MIYESKKIKKILLAIEKSVTLKESQGLRNTLYLDTSKTWKNTKGEKMYGGQGDDELSYNTKTHSFTAYSRMVENPSKPIIIVNQQTGAKMYFNLVDTDWDGSHEDIYGWNYKCTNNNGTFTLLVIND